VGEGGKPRLVDYAINMHEKWRDSVIFPSNLKLSRSRRWKGEVVASKSWPPPDASNFIYRAKSYPLTSCKS